MTLLARLLAFLQFLDEALSFLEFLTTPIGLVTLAGFGVYFPLQALGCDAPTASTLAGSVALALGCVITKPDF